MKPKQDLIKSIAQQQSAQYDTNDYDDTFVYSFNLDKESTEHRRVKGTTKVFSAKRNDQRREKYGY